MARSWEVRCDSLTLDPRQGVVLGARNDESRYRHVGERVQDGVPIGVLQLTEASHPITIIEPGGMWHTALCPAKPNIPVA